LGYESGSNWYHCGGLISVIDSSNTVTYFLDADGDGYGDAAHPYVSGSLTGYVQDNTDCDDTDATVYPGAPEIVDGKDNNCDGVIDNCRITRHHID
jgi:hypothetical protein